MSIRVTKHAEDRLKERSGISKSSLEKVTRTALEKGIRHDETIGSLRRYIDSLFLSRMIANNIRLWGDKVFLFRGETLITVTQIPHKYMRTVNDIREKKERDK